MRTLLPSTSTRRPGLPGPWRPDVSPLRFALAIGVVGAATALGALLGELIGVVAGALWPSEARTAVRVFAAVLAFNLAWWWFASAATAMRGEHTRVRGRDDDDATR